MRPTSNFNFFYSSFLNNQAKWAKSCELPFDDIACARCILNIIHNYCTSIQSISSEQYILHTVAAFVNSPLVLDFPESELVRHGCSDCPIARCIHQLCDSLSSAASVDEITAIISSSYTSSSSSSSSGASSSSRTSSTKSNASSSSSSSSAAAAAAAAAGSGNGSAAAGGNKDKHDDNSSISNRLWWILLNSVRWTQQCNPEQLPRLLQKLGRMLDQNEDAPTPVMECLFAARSSPSSENLVKFCEKVVELTVSAVGSVSLSVMSCDVM